MKAILYKGKPNNLSLEEVEQPKIVEGETLIRVRYAGFCGSDIERLETGNWPTDYLPVIPGHEFMGEVIKIAGDRSDLIGRRVVVEPIINCGKCEMCKAGHSHICYSRKLLGVHINGGMAEYAAVPVNNLYKIPDSITDEESAIIEPTAVSIHIFNRSNFKKGSSVLIVGAGTVGLLLAQVLRFNGAGTVDFLEIDEKRKEFCKKFGFKVVDPSNSGQYYNYGFEISGSEKGFFNLLESIKKRGTMILVGFPKKKYSIDLNDLIFNELELRGSLVYKSNEFEKAIDLLSKKVINARPLITDIFDLKDFTIALEKLKNRESMKVMLRFS